jgi:hypothetical protein
MEIFLCILQLSLSFLVCAVAYGMKLEMGPSMILSIGEAQAFRKAGLD